MNLSDKQDIYNGMQLAKGDGKALWAIAQDIHAQHAKVSKELTTLKEQQAKDQQAIKEKRKGSNLSNLLHDKEALRLRVMQDLLDGSAKQNAQASDKLAKLAGLDVADQDLTIELINYKDAVITCPDCGVNVYKPA